MKLLDLLRKKRDDLELDARARYWNTVRAVATRRKEPKPAELEREGAELAGIFDQLGFSLEDFERHVDTVRKIAQLETEASALPERQAAEVAARRALFELEKERQHYLEVQVPRRREELTANHNRARSAHRRAEDAQREIRKLRLGLEREVAPSAVERLADLQQKLSKLEADQRKIQRELVQQRIRADRAAEYLKKVSGREAETWGEQAEREQALLDELEAAEQRVERALATLREQITESEAAIAEALAERRNGAPPSRAPAPPEDDH